MTIGTLIEQLKKMDAEKSLVCQVIAKDGKTWNMAADFIDIPNSTIVQICVTHPDLKTLTDSDIEKVKS